MEVVPEYITDIGTKKGEKIDYAIFQENKPTILIECKHWEQNLNLHDGQLLRYFHVSKARFGLLTNGIEFRFYSDLVEPNKMDEKPFLEFNISEIKDSQIEELKKFHKSYFDIESIINNASELKYMNELKQLLEKEFATPSVDFVKLFAKQVYPSVVTQKVLEQFTELTKKATHQYISEVYTNRLKSALKKENESTINEASENPTVFSANKIETTEEELEAFLIIKTILRQKISVNRIYYRDAQSYFSVILDDNNRKPICRLYFGKKKFISFFDQEKAEIKSEIASLDDIFGLSEEIINSAINYES